MRVGSRPVPGRLHAMVADGRPVPRRRLVGAARRRRRRVRMAAVLARPGRVGPMNGTAEDALAAIAAAMLRDWERHLGSDGDGAGPAERADSARTRTVPGQSRGDDGGEADADIV